MKLAKMSLAAAMLLGVNVYAIDNVKVNGDVKVYYGTVDSDKKGEADIFDKDASYADTALHLGLAADLSEGVSAGISATAVSTLGLENNLVSGTWSNAHSATTQTGNSFLGEDPHNGAQVDDAMWIDEAWIAGTALDTTVKLGRQALDTPLAFTETWGIDTNTFEAAVLLNQSIPDTTLVATYIGKSNGSANDQEGVLNSLDAANAGYVAEGGKFNSFYDGVYALGAVNNSWKPLTAQAWYYDLQGVAQAYWLQADLNMEGILAGAQYASIDADGALAGADKDTGYAVMLGYALKDVVTVKAAFSSVDEDGTLGLGNVATTTRQSKLYTEMSWRTGLVSIPGADTIALSAETTVGPDIDLFLGYYYSEIEPNKIAGQDLSETEVEFTEIAFTASKSFGPLDTSIALIVDDLEATGPDDTNTIVTVDQKDTTLRIYLTYNF